MTIGRFLGGIGALICDPLQKRYLLLKRSDSKDFAAGIWEPVTGRVDQGESFEQALHREVMEETQCQVKVIGILGTTHFYRGKALPRNELVGIIYLCQLLPPAVITTSEEHTEFRWVTTQEAWTLLDDETAPVEWCRRIIQRADDVQKLSPSELTSFFASSSFELG